jgi:hypothetical protein
MHVFIFVYVDNSTFRSQSVVLTKKNVFVKHKCPWERQIPLRETNFIESHTYVKAFEK